MRILKKSLALLLALSMILGLVAINVAAEDTRVITFGKVRALAKAETQTVDVTMSIKTSADKKIAGISGALDYDKDVLTLTAITQNEATLTQLTDSSNHEADMVVMANFQGKEFAFTEETTLVTLTFQVKANPTVEKYPITFKNDSDLSFGDLAGDITGEVTITAGEIEVYETKTVKSFTPATATITYGANAEAVAAAFAGKKAEGTGKTSSNADFTENFDVTWTLAGFDTTPETLANATVNGTVAAIDGYTFEVQPTATVTFEKATTGFTVAPAAYKTMAVKDGAELSEIADIIAWIKAKEDKPANTTVTISAEGAAAPNVTFNWDAATKKDDADTLKTGVKDDTITLNVPVVATDASNVYYTLEGTEKAEVTITILAAEIAVEAITIDNTTAGAKPTVKATIPANELKAGEATIKVEFLKPVYTDGSITGWETAKYGETDAIFTKTVTAVADEATEIEVKAEKTLEEMGFANAGDVFAVKVLANDATLKDGKGLQVESKVMVTFSDNGSVGGIGVSQGNVKLPEKTETEEPGTEEPGTEEPGTEEPGTEEPGTEEPGTEEPAVDPSAPIEGAPFEDVTAEYAWAVESIATLKELGVVSGVDGANFKPDADITRAEFTKMVAVLFGLEVGAADTHFADCAADEWYTPYIVAANEAGFINGVNDTEFAPDATITREQACAILGRALKVAGEGELGFTDAAEIEDYAKAAIAALAEMGIINGYEDGSFAPANNITRAEAAKIMAGAYAKIATVE